MLWHCWLGDRKGIQPAKNWMMAVMIWLELCIIYSSSCHHRFHHPLLQWTPADQGSPGEWPLKQRERENCCLMAISRPTCVSRYLVANLTWIFAAAGDDLRSQWKSLEISRWVKLWSDHHQHQHFGFLQAIPPFCCPTNSVITLKAVLKIIGKDFHKIVIRRYLERSIQKKFFPTYTHYK